MEAMDQDNDQSICSSPNVQFLSENTNQEFDVTDQSGMNEFSSDSSEHNCNKTDTEKSSRRARTDSSARQNRKLKVKNDTSHRDIEKRRRDRINRSLWMLKDLVPAAKNRYGSKSGRLEKAELLELTVEYLRLLNKGNGVDSPLSVITPIKSEDHEQESQSRGLSLPQDLYIAGFKDGVLEVLNQLKKNSFLSDFQARDIVSRVNAKDRDGNLFNIAKATGVMDALGLAYDVDNNQGKLSDVEKQSKEFQTARDFSRSKSTDVDSGCQGISDDDRIRRTPSQCLLSRKRHQSVLDSYESDSISSDNSSERSCAQIQSPKRPFKSSSDESGNEKTKNFDNEKNFPAGFENFLGNSAMAASSGCPILFPAYALHASGTRYVPVVIPPSALFNSSQFASYASETAQHRGAYSQQRGDHSSLGQPPVLTRNDESFLTSSDKMSFSRSNYHSFCEQDHQQSLSSAPTSVISVGKSSDSCSDDEMDRHPRQLPVVTTSAVHDTNNLGPSPHSRQGYDSEPVESMSKDHSHLNVDVKFKGNDRRRSSNLFEYQSRLTDRYQHYVDGQHGVPSNSVLHYLQDKYTYKGFYR